MVFWPTVDARPFSVLAVLSNPISYMNVDSVIEMLKEFCGDITH